MTEDKPREIDILNRFNNTQALEIGNLKKEIARLKAELAQVKSIFSVFNSVPTGKI